uniref:ubiquitinyl hydrolase 1 n=1 Tax=Helianthus annuus TaxID=4232 RepID=A0A251UED6_HELAN
MTSSRVDYEMLVSEGSPQPMEAVADTIYAQAVDDHPSARFTWTIKNFSTFLGEKMSSDPLLRVVVFPNGEHLSLYLDAADSMTLPYGWSIYAQFSLAVVNQMNSSFTVRKHTQHQFNTRCSDWGFTSFMQLKELCEEGRGYLMNDTCVIEVDVTVRRTSEFSSHNPKRKTGYVGLKNEGASCCMNSLIQSLYHLPYLRKAVYQIPTAENDRPSGSVPLALQSVFYKLQHSETSVATKELIKSLGWEKNESFIQHEVQELSMVFCEKLDDKMKGTIVEGTILHLFEGHYVNFVECIDVDYRSSSMRSFYNLQLDVKGCRDVYASFDKYVEVERLEGVNGYYAETHGLQDAKKRIRFLDFPPVLQLQLKRFDYDFMRDTTVKINDRYEFPLQLDLDREDGKYLSPVANRNIRNLYTLYSVLVHSDGVDGGHYYAYVRPALSDQWFKFDDERVIQEHQNVALDEQYGGDELRQIKLGLNNSSFNYIKQSNAYMLVYIRESEKGNIICNVEEKDIAEHLRITLKKEPKEAHLYTIIKVSCEEDLHKQIGKHIYFDLVDHGKVCCFRIRKQDSFALIQETVAKIFKVAVHCQRLWMWAKRKNHTYRPHRQLTPQEKAQHVGYLRNYITKDDNAELHLFLEVEDKEDLQPISPCERTKDEIMLFFKHYDPLKEELRYVGKLFVKRTGKPVDILSKLKKLAGYGQGEEIELFEELQFEPNVKCVHIDKRLSFEGSKLEDGDIICFQKVVHIKNTNTMRYPDVVSFLEYVHNRQMIESQNKSTIN